MERGNTLQYRRQNPFPIVATSVHSLDKFPTSKTKPLTDFSILARCKDGQKNNKRQRNENTKMQRVVMVPFRHADSDTTNNRIESGRIVRSNNKRTAPSSIAVRATPASCRSVRVCDMCSSGFIVLGLQNIPMCQKEFTTNPAASPAAASANQFTAPHHKSHCHSSNG
jgi:hypothetical protein